MDDTIRLTIEDDEGIWAGAIEARTGELPWGVLKRFIQQTELGPAEIALLIDQFESSVVSVDITRDGELVDLDHVPGAKVLVLARAWLEAMLAPPLATSAPSPVSEPPESLWVEPSEPSVLVTHSDSSTPLSVAAGE